MHFLRRSPSRPRCHALVGCGTLVAAFAVSVAGCEPDLDSLSARYDQAPLPGDGGTGGMGGTSSSGGTSNSNGGETGACEDGKRGADESDIDCGGPSECQRCDVNRVCTVNDDCATAFCRSNRCTEPSCEDKVRNQNETDVDCGGDCAPDQRCAEGEGCDASKDCETGFCDDGVCASHCLSGVKDGDETDVDCGGFTCDPCPVDSRCDENGDCETGLCLNEFCANPTCDDELKNQGETDVDCGGDCAPAQRCKLGDDCEVADDCDSYVCEDDECVPDDPIVAANVIDLFEDGDAKIEEVSGREGDWYYVHDPSPEAMQLSGNELIPGKRGSASEFAYHTSGSGYTSWGAGIGLDLYNPGSGKETYDASGYTGITFWGRASADLPIKVMFPDGNSDAAGGTCTGCYSHFYKSITLKTQWQKFTIVFADLTTKDGPENTAEQLDTERLVSIQFRTAAGAVFDFWIDDIVFTQ